MAVDIMAGTAIESGPPHQLFETGITVDAIRDQFAASADGQKFLIQLTDADSEVTPINVVINWAAALKK